MQTYIQTDRHTYVHTYIHTDIQTYIHTYIHTYRQTYRHTYIHTYIHTYSTYILYIQTDRQTDRHRQTYVHIAIRYVYTHSHTLHNKRGVLQDDCIHSSLTDTYSLTITYLQGGLQEVLVLLAPFAHGLKIEQGQWRFNENVKWKRTGGIQLGFSAGFCYG